jgi:hypothetical protein
VFLASKYTRKIDTPRANLHFLPGCVWHNQRKGRHGAFWEDRYHATAVETDDHLHRRLVYIHLNMVRAPSGQRIPVIGTHSGYREIQNPAKWYGIIDLRELSSLCGFRGDSGISASASPLGRRFNQRNRSPKITELAKATLL